MEPKNKEALERYKNFTIEQKYRYLAHVGNSGIEKIINKCPEIIPEIPQDFFRSLLSSTNDIDMAKICLKQFTFEEKLEIAKKTKEGKVLNYLTIPTLELLKKEKDIEKQEDEFWDEIEIIYAIIENPKTTKNTIKRISRIPIEHIVYTILEKRKLDKDLLEFLLKRKNNSEYLNNRLLRQINSDIEYM